jgi:uncharacterized protein (DUF2147 family)
MSIRFQTPATPRLGLALAAVLALSAFQAQAQTPANVQAPAPVQPASAVGDWVTAGGDAMARIEPCGNRLCGTLVWLKDASDRVTGKPYVDEKNPDRALRGRPLLGLQILRGFMAAGRNLWAGGRIYSPDSGKTYKSKLRLESDNKLKVEGCLAVFCGGQTWTRVE